MGWDEGFQLLELTACLFAKPCTAKHRDSAGKRAPRQPCNHRKMAPFPSCSDVMPPMSKFERQEVEKLPRDANPIWGLAHPASNIEASNLVRPSCSFVAQGSTAHLLLWRSEFSKNSAAFKNGTLEARGGAVRMAGPSSGGAIEACQFVDNSADGSGGAVDITHWDALSVTECHFLRNKALRTGGALGIGGLSEVLSLPWGSVESCAGLRRCWSTPRGRVLERRARADSSC